MPPMTMGALKEKKILFDEKTASVWPNAELSEKHMGICVKAVLAILRGRQTQKAEFSHAIAVMDKIGGCEGES